MQPPSSTSSPNEPITCLDQAAIREQMERLLSSPLFKNSKRYPNLLRYIVEHTLDGHKAELKERTLGVEVFGRSPGYDTNADPIVRAAAGEIRKRIAQYYLESGHENELRINLAPGSYVPVFGMPNTPVVAPVQAALPPPVDAAAPARQSWWRYGLLGIAGLAVVTVAIWQVSLSRPTALEQFWRPVLESSEPLLFCVGQRQYLGSSPEYRQKDRSDIPRPEEATTRDSNDQTTVAELYYLGSQNVAVPDMVTITRLAGVLERHAKAYQIRGQSSTSLADLRGNPVILIGAFNNDWTLRLAGPLRFGFQRNGQLFWVSDRNKPADHSRSVAYDMPYLQLPRDYAVITRVHDPTTERIVVIVAGLTGYGTLAAGEFLSNPAYLEAMSKTSPSNWASRNLQVVISTKVINGNSGPPEILDKYFW
jgi:hypothetical protein